MGVRCYVPLRSSDILRGCLLVAAAGSTAARVVMVTDDVSAGGRAALATLCTVVPVGDFAMDVAQHYQPRFSDSHDVHSGESSWLRHIFTKFHLFGLTPYGKLVWLDADMFALSNPDALFKLRPPADVCSAYQWEQEAVARTMAAAETGAAIVPMAGSRRQITKWISGDS
eukprot:jgi/Tetstr1/443162/TSEL_031202.t1